MSLQILFHLEICITWNALKRFWKRECLKQVEKSLIRKTTEPPNGEKIISPIAIHSTTALSHWRQDQHKVRHVWSMGVLLFLLREIQMSTQVIWNYFTKKFPNKFDFRDVIFNFSKMLCVLPSSLCMTQELWPRRFIWHQCYEFYLHSILFL